MKFLNIKKPWMIIALIAIAPVIINEIVVALASSMLGIGYHPIPASIHYEIAMLREDYGWALIVAVVLLITIVVGIIGTLLKNIIGIGILEAVRKGLFPSSYIQKMRAFTSIGL